MNGSNILADTSLIVNLFNGVEAVREHISKRTIFVSFITELELLSYSNLTVADRKILQSFLSDCFIIEMDNEIKKATIDLRIKYKTKLPDSIIAATAIRFDLPLFTMDKGFKKIEKLNSIILSV
jgi:predicted nucleic acid-binding protein